MHFFSLLVYSGVGTCLVGTQERVWCKKNNIYSCEVVQLQILVSQSVVSNTEESWWLFLFVFVCMYVHACECVCARQLHRAPGTGLCRLGLLNPQLISGEWEESTQMAVNVQKRRLRETCQLRFKFLLLISVTLQYSSNICLFYPKKYKNTEAWWHLKMCFLMSAQTTEQEPALVIHHHKLRVLTWHVFRATDDGLVCSANTENGLRLNWKCGIEQSGKTPWKIN